MYLPKKVKFLEVGMRDGLQNEKILLSTEQKLDLIDDLVGSGIRAIEAGSFVRPDKMPQMADTGDLIRRLNAEERYKDIEFRVLVPNDRGFRNAVESGCKNIKIGVSASEAHNMANYHRTPEQSIAAFEAVFREAQEHGIHMIGTVQMGFGSPWDGEIPAAKIIALVDIYRRLGVESVGIGDTASMASPRKVYDLCCRLQDRFPEISFKLHFHNARGLAIANVLAAMEAGVTEFDGAFAGLGGCPFVPNAAGNVSTEDLINLMDELGIETGIDIIKVLETAHKVEKLVGHAGNSSVLRAGTSRDLVRTIAGRNKTAVREA